MNPEQQKVWEECREVASTIRAKIKQLAHMKVYQPYQYNREKDTALNEICTLNNGMIKKVEKVWYGCAKGRMLISGLVSTPMSPHDYEYSVDYEAKYNVKKNMEDSDRQQQAQKAIELQAQKLKEAEQEKNKT